MIHQITLLTPWLKNRLFSTVKKVSTLSQIRSKKAMTLSQIWQKNVWPVANLSKKKVMISLPSRILMKTPYKPPWEFPWMASVLFQAAKPPSIFLPRRPSGQRTIAKIGENWKVRKINMEFLKKLYSFPFLFIFPTFLF